MAESEKKTPFARFFSSVEGHLVSRYGSATQAQGPQQIGARRFTAPPGNTWAQSDVGGGVEWHTHEVTAITDDEARLYAREYDQAVREGALVERKESDYLAFVAKHEAEANKSAARDKAESDRAAARAKTESERSTPATIPPRRLVPGQEGG